MKKLYFTTDSGFEKADTAFRKSGKVLILLLCLAVGVWLIAKEYLFLPRLLPIWAVVIIAIASIVAGFFLYAIITANPANEQQSAVEEWDEQQKRLQLYQRLSAKVKSGNDNQNNKTNN